LTKNSKKPKSRKSKQKARRTKRKDKEAIPMGTLFTKKDEDFHKFKRGFAY